MVVVNFASRIAISAAQTLGRFETGLEMRSATWGKWNQLFGNVEGILFEIGCE